MPGKGEFPSLGLSVSPSLLPSVLRPTLVSGASERRHPDTPVLASSVGLLPSSLHLRELAVCAELQAGPAQVGGGEAARLGMGPGAWPWVARGGQSSSVPGGPPGGCRVEENLPSEP